MSDYGYGDYIAYRMKMNVIGFVIAIFGAILYFGATAIYESSYSFLSRTLTSDIWALSLSVAITGWAVVGFLWGCYVVYKDGK